MKTTFIKTLIFIVLFSILSFEASFAGVLVYSTYLGGGDYETGNAIAIDGLGNAYITGVTGSTDFPTTSGAFDTSFNGGSYDVFVSKLNARGTMLVYSTILGGGSNDEGRGITIDGSGNVFITGYTGSSTFPTTPGAFNTVSNNGDAFVTKVDSTGTSLIYSTYLGGRYIEYGNGIAIDSSGNAYITGWTDSDNFPTTPGAFDTSFNFLHSYHDAFVSKLNANGTALVYSTYLGGVYDDTGNAIAIDSSGNAYITGWTDSDDFPTTTGTFDTVFNWGSYADAFVSKLNETGTALVYSTYLGGERSDYGIGIVVDSSGNTYITGETSSSSFPTTPGAFDTSFNEYQEVFLSKVNPNGTALVYSTYLGGGGYDWGTGITIDESGNTYITGYTDSSDFPTTAGALDTSYNGGTYDAFMSKLNPSGTMLVYSTYLGGGNSDYGLGIAVDSSGNVYITGCTWSTDFPTTPGALDTLINGLSDVFVTKLFLGPLFVKEWMRYEE